MSNKDSGFTILELLVVLIVMGIIVARALSQVLAVKAYRLPADGAAVARGPTIDLSGVCVRLCRRMMASRRGQSEEELRKRRFMG
jgi:prepilin-type N-terminal cleavage/methylation domain-containing protein